MVRYTKRGSVDGEPNLILPPLSERVIQVRCSEWNLACSASWHAVPPGMPCGKLAPCV